MAQSTIVGPCYIGKNSLVKIGAKIYGGTTIGPVCKIGGEVENSIFQGYSNKQHDGYVGHSFIGEWCNLGAGTNTSDLKNDYTPVRVAIEGEEFNTGSMFVGLMMGDHSKSGIGTQFGLTPDEVRHALGHLPVGETEAIRPPIIDAVEWSAGRTRCRGLIVVGGGRQQQQGPSRFR